ncbi:ribosome biogenesis GTPase Der [Thioalkalivibrio sp. XN279]|uniref:ribosome biogenesis GTPase Der n=1 Tax=Thioalkalivibrio sp. XN279 TaxID=2714953 RepID=UPI00140D5015|nr:ribosome biogenesis GTPase Der [Thioalkalivibrio sp. XN279]NHA15622.1 ribosome biogenesis GTPase Der [Thioalkalivibrio sp. XN279]
MLPVVALVGRPNVGKSTLFNFLTRTRDALVADLPGLTRDRQYGFGRVGPVPYIVVDTGGLSGTKDELDGLMARQTLHALDEADAVLFLVDAREGLTAADEQVATMLRRRGRAVRLVVNKAEGQDTAVVGAEFHRLGLGEPAVISSAHGDNVRALMEAVLEPFPVDEEADAAPEQGVRVAVIGRPNVGKSTLINRMIGEDRLVAYDLPGTTRDAVEVPFVRDGRRYLLVDTAGVRRRSRVSEAVEKFSVIKTLGAIDAASVVIAVLDAREGVTDQDASLLGLAAERGRAMVIAVNKWDGLPPDQRDNVRRQLELKLPFLDYAPVQFISALHGTGVGDLFGLVDASHEAAHRDLPTPELTRVLQDAVSAHQPPISRGRRIKLRYAHQGGRNPPVIVVHGTQAELLPDSYRRYLANIYRKAFRLQGTPVRIELRSGENPYAGRRNPLTPRQQRKRERLMRHVKKRR